MAAHHPVDVTTDLSRDFYDTVRNSWISKIRYHGFNPVYGQAPLDKAFAYWAERHPEFTAGDDWLAAGLDAHRTYWQQAGRICNRGTCNEHGDAS